MPASDRHKIYLRPLEKADVTDRYVAWLNDPEIYRYLTIRYNVPLSRQDVAAFVENCAQVRRPHWGIFYDDRHIGNISCSLYDLNARWIDISFLLGEKGFWGQGITTNAVASVLDYLFFEQDFHRVQGGVCSGHDRSIQVFQKLGFRQESCLVEASVIDGEYEDDLKFGILKREWEARPFKGPRYKVHPLKWSYFAQPKAAGTI